MNRLLFEKSGIAIYLSHLDLMRVFQRAFRRAGIQLKHSQGYAPRAYVSILLPLSVGVSSRCELMEFALEEEGALCLTDVPALLNRTMPEGIRVLDCYESTRKAKELQYLSARITMEYDQGIPDGCTARLLQLFSRPSLPVPKHSKTGEVREQDIIPLLEKIQIHSEENRVLLNCLVQAQNPGLNPLQLVQAISLFSPQDAADFIHCCRMEVLDAALEHFR